MKIRKFPQHNTNVTICGYPECLRADPPCLIQHQRTGGQGRNRPGFGGFGGDRNRNRPGFGGDREEATKLTLGAA
jgi:hypothetical protein